MRFEERLGCYVGEWLMVPTAVFQGVLATRIRAGDNQDAALEDLLDELSWSLDVPGVRPTRRALDPGTSGCGGTTPWPLRFRVAVVQPEPVLAEDLQFELE